MYKFQYRLSIIRLFIILFSQVCGAFAMNAQCEIIPLQFPFLHGVASGDATQNQVILWTRITVPLPVLDLPVKWVIASDSSLQNLILTGEVSMSSSDDYTVKVDVGPLEPDHWYYYAFETAGIRSMIGRTHTLPESAERFDFAAFSCSNYEVGYFNAYRDALERDEVQAIVHMGDYYYEYSVGEVIAGRRYNPDNTLYSLDDYRQRHAQICTDENLAELRRQFPWYVIWDDHEFANDAFTDGASAHDINICAWETRREAARKAYFEWMPIRENTERTVERHHSIGNLVSLNFLDTRIKERSLQVASDSPLVDDSLRSIIGQQQFDTLLFHLRNDSLIPWKLIFTSVMMTKAIDINGWPLDTDLWEGYRYERRRLWDSLQTNNIHGLISIAGDFHSSWAGDLPLNEYDPTNFTGSIGNEFTVCAATSAPHTVGDIPTFMSLNSHVKWIEQEHNGYMLCSLTQDSVMAHWRYCSTVNSSDYTPIEGKTAVVYRGSPFVMITDSIPIYEANSVIQLHGSAQQILTADGNLKLSDVVVFPNPLQDRCHVKWSGPCGTLYWKLYALSGQLIYDGFLPLEYAGLHEHELNLSHLSPGFYFLQLKSGGDEVTRKVIVTGLVNH